MTCAEIIANLDLSRVQTKLVEAGHSQRAVQKLVSRYRHFLAECLGSPERVHQPSAEADIVWHLHILDTARYAQDCQRIFGRFLHHDPHAFADEGRSFRSVACGDVSPASITA